MVGRLSPPPDAQRILFQSLDISRTVMRIEARYSNSGRGRPRYSVRAMLLDNLRWREAAKVRMHVALCYSVILAVAITAHRMGKPELAHSIKAFQ